MHVGEERQGRALAALVHQRLGRAERGLGGREQAQDEAGGFGPHASGRRPGIPAAACFQGELFQQIHKFADNREGIGNVEDVGLALGPAAIGVQIDGAAFADEAPAHHVRFLAVAAGGQAFGWRGVEPVCPT